MLIISLVMLCTPVQVSDKSRTKVLLFGYKHVLFFQENLFSGCPSVRAALCEEHCLDIGNTWSYVEDDMFQAGGGCYRCKSACM